MTSYVYDWAATEEGVAVTKVTEGRGGRDAEEGSGGLLASLTWLVFVDPQKGSGSCRDWGRFRNTCCILETLFHLKESLSEGQSLWSGN